MSITNIAASDLPEPATKKTLKDHKTSPATILIFAVLLIAGVAFTCYSLVTDMSAVNFGVTTWVPYILLGIALLIALGFEFVNGFHDTANGGSE